MGTPMKEISGGVRQDFYIRECTEEERSMIVSGGRYSSQSIGNIADLESHFSSRRRFH